MNINDLGLLIGDKIGQGTFAQVHVGQDINTSEKYAIKIIPTQHKDLAHREATCLAILDHPNILQLEFVEWDVNFPITSGAPSSPCSLSVSSMNNSGSFSSTAPAEARRTRRSLSVVIVTEYAENGSLLDLVLGSSGTTTGGLDEKTAQIYFKQLISGLKEIHLKGYIHRDIKLENLLLDSQSNLKIADFGLACRKSQWNHNVCGSPGYIAPEILQPLKDESEYDEAGASSTTTTPSPSSISFAHEVCSKVDIFAAGVVLFQMLTGYSPFHNAQSSDPLYALIMEGKYEEFWSFHEKRKVQLSSDVKELLMGMFAEDPIKRVSIEDIQHSRWFAEPTLEQH